MMRQSRMSTRGGPASALSRGQLGALVFLFVVTGLCFIMLDRGRILDPLKRPVERPILAISERFTALGDDLRHFTDRFGDARTLRAENDQLRAENAQLQADAARVKELERENAQLTEQAHFAQKYPDVKLQPARVIGRDPTKTEKYLIIDRGSDDGLQIGMPVVSPNFLVGLVSEVYPKRAKVRLIIDQDMQIGVLLQDERTPGILYGNWQNGKALTVKHLDRSAPVPPNTKIVTSNLTNRVPPGILVGVTINSRKDVQNDTLEADVIPLVDFDGLETVTVLLTDQR